MQDYDARVAELDGFGVAGYTGMVDYLTSAYGIDYNEVIFASHRRGSTNIDAAMKRFLKWLGRPKAGGGGEFDAGILLQVVTDPAAALVQELRDAIANVHAGGTPDVKYGLSGDEIAELNKVRDIVFIGTWIGGSFAAAMRDLGDNGRYCRDVLAIQVVSHPQLAQTQLAIEYREALKAFDPTLQPDVFSFEGYITMRLFAEALRQAGPDLSTESLVATLESMDEIDIGLGVDLGFSGDEHQASRSNWAQSLSDQCELVEFDL